MKQALRWTFPLLALALAVLPIKVFFDARGGLNFFAGLEFRAASLAAFPLFGLLAFTLLWMQLMLGSLMPWMKKLYRGIERFHRSQGVLVFLFAVTHPSLLIIGVGIERYLAKDFISSGLTPYLLLGQTAIFVLGLTVLMALLRTVTWVKHWWRAVHLLNYVIFTLVWFHSWNLGSDIRGTALEYIWVGYGLAFIGAVILRLAGLTWPRSLRVIVPSLATEPPSALRAEAQPGGDNLVQVAKLDDLVEGQPFCGFVNGKKIVLFRFGDQVYALDNRCNHQDGSLCDGMLEGKTIECPLHFSRFDVTTGALIDGPATQPQRTFPVEVRDRAIFVRA